MTLTNEDLKIAKLALNEVCNGAYAIEDWEFHTLMGCERQEALEVMKKINAIIGHKIRDLKKEAHDE